MSLIRIGIIYKIMCVSIFIRADAESDTNAFYIKKKTLQKLLHKWEHFQLVGKYIKSLIYY